MQPRRIHIGSWIRNAAMAAAGATLAAQPQPHDDSGFQALLKQGFELHQQARFAEAIPVLERARQQEPADYFANLLLGIDLLRVGKATAAIPRLELAARAKPGEEFPEDYLGEAEASLGHNARAAEAYREAVLRGHGSEQSIEAWAGFALERFRQIGEGLRASQEGVAAAHRLQAAAAKPASCEGSIPAMERSLAAKDTATDVEVAFRLSICYAVEAGKTAARLETGAEDLAAVHKLRGDVLLRLKGDSAGAQSEYKQAIAIQSGDPSLLERLAEAQLSAGDTEAARKSAQAALAIDPHRREALHTLAAIAMSDRDYGQAIPWLRQLVESSPGDRESQVELGRSLAQTGDSAAALRLLAPALASGYPDEKGALHSLLGRMLRKLGRDDEAANAEAEARRLSDAYQASSRAGAHAEPDEHQ